MKRYPGVNPFPFSIPVQIYSPDVTMDFVLKVYQMPDFVILMEIKNFAIVYFQKGDDEQICLNADFIEPISKNIIKASNITDG